MPKCNGCGQEIKWVFMASGKRMPLDVKPLSMVVITSEFLPDSERPDFPEPIRTVEVGNMATVYMPHWKTCPKAKDFKKKG